MSADTRVAGGTPVVLLVLDEFSGESLLGAKHRIDAARLLMAARPSVARPDVVKNLGTAAGRRASLVAQ